MVFKSLIGNQLLTIFDTVSSPICGASTSMDAANKLIDALKPEVHWSGRKFKVANTKIYLTMNEVLDITSTAIKKDSGAKATIQSNETAIQKCKDLYSKVLTKDLEGDKLLESKPFLKRWVTYVWQWLRPRQDHAFRMNFLRVLKTLNAGLATLRAEQLAAQKPVNAVNVEALLHGASGETQDEAPEIFY